jgi:thiopeptide-type bacteriocin biosynthesis protein
MGPVNNGAGLGYVNQFVAILVKNSSSYEQLVQRAIGYTQDEQPREFTPGSEWMYYKLYCGVKSADKILQYSVKPLCEAAIGEELADKWFFIRYYDPDFHIRLRFHVPDPRRMGELAQKVNVWLAEPIKKKYIWKVQQDTYRREVERYGVHAIAMAETLFYYDSIAFLQMLDLTTGDDRENLRWLWGLKAVDDLLNNFDLSLRQKYELMDTLRKAFWTEMQIDKFFKQQFDEKYRNHRKMIGAILASTPEGQEAFNPLLEILREKSVSIKEVASALFQLMNANRLEVALPDLLASYIHMMINRISLSDSRKQEMVMYDLLARHYQSDIARNRTLSV